jgi:hypothetical protein
LNCDGRGRAHPLAKVLTGRKAAITLTSSGVLLLLSGCGDVVTTHYETYDQAAREGLFDRGWLPEVIPISSRDIRASNNLDRNTSEGEFSFAPETMASFMRLLVPFSHEDAADADLPEVVARREAEGYVSYTLTSGSRVWLFFLNGADGHAYYRLWPSRKHGEPTAAPAGSAKAPPATAAPRR